MFVLTVVFGLFHGLLLFPTLLAVLGPEERGLPTVPTISLLGSAEPGGRTNSSFQTDLVGFQEANKRNPLEQPWQDPSRA